jgi:hypothetical protein
VVRKRAPGGGRKPNGPLRHKTATLTTRITEGTRAALVAAAERGGRSLSQEVELRLIATLDMEIEQTSALVPKRDQ